MDTDFRRARTDEQRAVRRGDILTLTRRLLAEHRVADVSLNEIARRVGLAKANVLRYFGSREAILLVLLSTDYEEWVSHVLAALPSTPATDDALAGALASTLADQPLLCELLTAAPTVLEHNVTPDEVRGFKLSIQGSMERLVDGIEGRLGDWNERQRGQFLGGLHAFITHTWGLANPSPALVAAMAVEPRIVGLPGGFGQVLQDALATLLAGVRAA